MILFRNLAIARGPRTLFDRASLSLERSWKIGLIGANGCGKSSLLSLMAGELTADRGECEIQPGTRIAWIEQEAPALARPVLEYLLDADTALRAAEAAVQAAESAHDEHDDGHALALAHERFEHADGYTARARAAALLSGLGFAPGAGARAVREFSGGYRMRLNLGRALMSPSDLLLLDEPTNHLDIDTVLWLEGWLRAYPGTLLIVSHDRDFLDRVIDRTLAILPGGDAGTMRLYTGNYSSYELQRASELIQQAAFATRQAREIKRIEGFVSRFKAKASKARQAQSRMKQLEKMEKVAPVYAADAFHFEFEEPERQPERIVSLEDVSVGYGERVVLSNVSITLTRNDRIAVIGANGTGKTTLVRMLAGELAPTGGRRSTGRDIVIGYFAQHQIETLRPEETPLGMMTRLFRADREQNLRDFLGGFGFAGEAAQRAIGPLSGGEKSRLALAALVRRRPNLLLLDEPTNHLDLEMRRSLSMALQSYEGALIIVSHDRHLLSTCADRIVVVADGGLADFDGDLEDYRKARLKTERVKREDTPKNNRRNARRADAIARNTARDAVRAQLKPLEKQLLAIESRIAKLSAETDAARNALAAHGIYEEAQRERLKQLMFTEARLKADLAQAEDDWLHTSARIETLRAEAAGATEAPATSSASATSE
ncbi:MAG: ATP-binding cassette domain-containing protein [Betaproteobacteria bacterium]|nr:ATP-binding cassette domain-containing protein [Betaproteobacteria bacterium]